MKTVFITGVAGMIGSHLIDDLLEKGYKIIGIDNLSYGKIENIRHNLPHPNFQFYKADVCDFDTMKLLAKDCEWIIHLAAYKKIAEKDFSMHTFSTNGNGTENIFKVAKLWGSKVLFASTSDVYGTSPELPLKENGDLLIGPSMIKRWNYAVSKLYGEQMAYAYYHDYGVPIVIIRYFGGFSPRSSFAWSGGHVPIFIRAILNNEEIVIHGDGTQTRSMGFVSDLVDGTILALENEKSIGEIFNIGNNEEISVIESAKMIHSIAKTGNPIKLKLVPMEEVFGKYKDIMRRVPDLTKANNILGYYPKVKFEQAITLTIEEIRKKE